MSDQPPTTLAAAANLAQRFPPDPPGTARLMEIIFPANTNNLGAAFGGHILSLMDKAAALAAGRHVRGTVVTASIDKVDFRVPIQSGDVVEFIGVVMVVGRTSLRVQVDVYRESRQTQARTLATSGVFVMVHLGNDGLPAVVPPLPPAPQVNHG
jgi:acyl-CoA thioesterase YciA